MDAMRKTSAFTLVELLIAMTVGAIALAIFYNVLMSAFNSSSATNKQVRATTDIKRALNFMDNDTVLTTDFLTAVPSQYDDAYGPHRLGTDGSEAWSYKGSSADNRVLLLQNLATTQNGGGSDRRPIYINSPSFNCSDTMSRQPKLMYAAIYFVYQETLYRRLLTDKSQTLCPGQTPYQQQTCPPDINHATWDSSCQANDIVLATNVTKFEVSYYQSGDTLGGTLVDGQYTSSDPDVLTIANVVQVTIAEDFTGLAEPVEITQTFARIN